MNQAREQPTIGEIAKSRVFDEKVLLAPSLRAGQQWVEKTVREGTDVLNLRVATPIGLALELAGPAMSAQDAALLARGAGPLLIESIWPVVEGGAYFRHLQQGVASAEAIWRSLDALRLSGVEVDDLKDDRLEQPERAADLRRIYAAYLAALERHRLVDHAQVYRLARASVRLQDLGFDFLLLTPIGLRLSQPEKKFVESFPAERRIDCVAAPTHPRRRAESDDERFGSIANASADPPKVTFSHAVGEANEVRAVFRRCLANGVALDNVEALITDAETYVPLFRDIGASLADAEKPGGVPMTFADGLPVATSRPARALTAWLQWIEDDYPQSVVLRMLTDGLVHVRADERRLSGELAAYRLRSLAIGWGSDRYAPALDAAIDDAEAGLSDFKESDDPTSFAPRISRLADWRCLRDAIVALLGRSRTLKAGGSAAFLAARDFLENFAGGNGEVDEYARRALLDGVERLRDWSERLSLPIDVPSRLAALVDSTRVLGSGPRPGHLHVASLASGGYAGRDVRFALGLDDGRFPGAALQDPVLLDFERRSLSPSFPTSADTAAERLAALHEFALVSSGTTHLSWSSRDAIAGEELYPCSAVLAIYRATTGRDDGTLADLEEAAGQPACFAPNRSEEALSESERRLHELHVVATPATRRTRLHRRFPLLARGDEAALRRREGILNEFVGYVPEAGADLDPFSRQDVVLSASSLEKAGRCPLSYFYEKGLRLTAPDDFELDLDCWLDAASAGALLHELFRRFLSELVSSDLVPDAERDRPRLRTLLDELVDEYRRRTPPPTHAAFESQRRDLVRASEAFLSSEALLCRSHRPRYFEASIGVEPCGPGSPLDQDEPGELTLPSGRRVRIRGRVDRIDEILETPGSFAIWDYKTGSDWSYRQEDPFRQGRRVQSALYRSLTEAVLRSRIDPAARVTSFGYFFTGARTHGLRLAWTEDRLSDGPRLVDALATVIASGAFLPTDDASDCKYCDFAAACGDVVQLAENSSSCLDGGDARVVPHRELRRNG